VNVVYDIFLQEYQTNITE